jgi:glycosyltransferase involved in cell wall biosynthesis
MEIAFFTESYRPNLDGVAMETAALARALHRAGHSVRVYAPTTAPGAARAPEGPDDPVVVRSRSVPMWRYPDYRWAVFPFRGPLGAKFGRDVDVVHLHTPAMMGGVGMMAARRFDKPIVGTFHTNVWEMADSFGASPFVGIFFRAAEIWTLGTYWRCDATTAPSEAARDALLSRARKPFRRPIEVIPNGVEVERFRPGILRPDWRARCGLPEVPLVTFLGRLTVDKGVHRFLDAVAEVGARRPLAALIAGVGPEEPTVRERLAREPVLARSVRYVGPVAEEEKPSLLAQSDVYVLPSTSDTSSVSLLEAMSSGVACLSTSVGGPGDLVRDDRTGRQFDPRVPGELAQRLDDLLGDDAARRRLGASARSWVIDTASIDHAARRFISLYELVRSERTSRGAVDVG